MSKSETRGTCTRIPRNRFVASLGEANLFDVVRHQHAPGDQTIVETREGFRMVAPGRPPGGNVTLWSARTGKVLPKKLNLSNELDGVVVDLVY